MTKTPQDMLQILLDNLSDGVLVIDLDGAILIANPAFCQMFALTENDWVGKDFRSLFLLTEGLDAFTEAVLDAVAQQGNVSRRIVQVRINDESRSLTVTATRLATAQEAVVVTVADVTEIKELREAEVRLAKTVEAQLGELQTAYRDLESRQSEITSITRRSRVIRITTIILAMGLFAGLGLWRLQPLDLFITAPDPIPAPRGTDLIPLEQNTVTVVPTELKSTVSLQGRLGLGLIEEIVSPFEGHVQEVYVRPGEEVTKGDRLLTFDTGLLATELRRAEVSDIRAREKVTELENWASSDEMARARAALRRSRITREEAEQAKVRSAFLLEEGIISEQEHEQAIRNSENRALDYAAAQRDFASVEEKGNPEAIRIARLEAETARVQLETQREKLKLATVHAPLTGILIAADGPDNKPLVKGRPVTQGERLARVADFNQLSVATYVDEVEVRKMVAGQRATITGPGFPDMKIDGTVTRVASRARGSLGRGAPQFEIVVDLDRLGSPDRAALRVGMSAYVEITIHSRPEALLVPLTAVYQTGNTARLKVVDSKTGEIQDREVQTGVTTLDSVEVTAGLTAGDTVVVP